LTVRLPEAAPNREMVAVAPDAPIVNEITMLNSWSLWKLPKVVAPSSMRTVLLVKKSRCKKLRNESTG